MALNLGILERKLAAETGREMREGQGSFFKDLPLARNFCQTEIPEPEFGIQLQIADVSGCLSPFLRWPLGGRRRPDSSGEMVKSE